MVTRQNHFEKSSSSRLSVVIRHELDSLGENNLRKFQKDGGHLVIEQAYPR